jgi:hypothetical protein
MHQNIICFRKCTKWTKLLNTIKNTIKKQIYLTAFITM